MTKHEGRGFAVRASESGPITFLASTNGLARDGLIIEQGAWDLENYRKNPVVLWSHRYDSLPIGRTTDVRTSSAGLVADLEFDQEDSFARDIERKIRNGYLNTVSVGWDTLEQVGNLVKKAELLDISVVPVPGDANAVALARSLYGATARSEDRDEYTFTAVASSGGPDRDGEIVDLDGLNLAEFAFTGSPVYLNHDRGHRIGKVTRHWRERRGLMVEIRLDLTDRTGRAHHAARQIQSGEFDGVSIGFRVKAQEGKRIIKAVLEEISVGRNPTDPGAVIVSRSERPIPAPDSRPDPTRHLAQARRDVWNTLPPDQRADFNSILANQFDARHRRLHRLVQDRLALLNRSA